MKKLTIFESTIIGLFVGFVISTYITFLNSSEMFIGKILSWISLIPLFDITKISTDNSLIIPFIFIVLVYAIYGFIIGFLIQKISKAKFIIPGLIVILIIGGFFEQRSGSVYQSKVSNINIPMMAAVIKAVPKSSEQYFGNEAFGDLNSDGKDDVAFVTSRADNERGMLYYLLVSVRTDQGHAGSNLIFLGDKVEPKIMVIENGIIDIGYIDHSIKNATSTQHMYAGVVDGILKQVQKPNSTEQDSATTTSSEN